MLATRTSWRQGVGAKTGGEPSMSEVKGKPIGTVWSRVRVRCVNCLHTSHSYPTVLSRPRHVDSKNSGKIISGQLLPEKMRVENKIPEFPPYVFSKI